MRAGRRSRSLSPTVVGGDLLPPPWWGRVGVGGKCLLPLHPPPTPPPPEGRETDGELDGLDAFAARHAQEHAGKALVVERLTGFCLLARRDVLDHIGGFDERDGVGFFDDDDLSVRALRAGYRLLVAQDVFVHHFGSRTFLASGIDCRQQLHANLALFREKWGDQECAGYRQSAAIPAVESGNPGAD